MISMSHSTSFTTKRCPACAGPLFEHKYEETDTSPIGFTDNLVELCVRRCGYALVSHLETEMGEKGLVPTAHGERQGEDALTDLGGAEKAYAWMEVVAKENGVDLAAV
jgi:hypothetical protein